MVCNIYQGKRRKKIMFKFAGEKNRMLSTAQESFKVLERTKEMD